MKKRKITKKQMDAIESLIYDLDELDNKPRRLFSSLINFADAFLDEKTCNKLEHKNEIIESIEEFQDIYYNEFKVHNFLAELHKTFKKIKRKSTSRNNKMIKVIRDEANDEEDADRKDWIYRQGVEEALMEYYLAMNTYITERLKY